MTFQTRAFAALLLIATPMPAAAETPEPVATIMRAWSNDVVLQRAGLVMTQVINSCDCDPEVKAALLPKIEDHLDAEVRFAELTAYVSDGVSPEHVAETADFLSSDLGQQTTDLAQAYFAWSTSPRAHPSHMLDRAKTLEADAQKAPRRFALYHRIAFSSAQSRRRRELLTAFDIMMAGTLTSIDEGRQATATLAEVRAFFKERLGGDPFRGDPMMIVEMDMTYAALSEDDLEAYATWLETEAAQAMIEMSHEGMLNVLIDASRDFSTEVVAIISERDS
ncbi:MAG: hypothetical protein AAF675_12705 [Pseudomonadota bacterium]